MNTVNPARVYRSIALLIVLGLALLVGASSAHAALLPASGDPSLGRLDHLNPVTWLGMAGDGRWSNAANWDGHRLPGPDDVVRFTAESPDARVDAAFAGDIGGLELESSYVGTVSLEKTVAVRGDLRMQGGTFAGETADLWIGGAADVSGGMLTTPSGTMRVERMEIQAPAIVRMGQNGKLNLAGDGTPLAGDGVLDVTTNTPNSVEYTGRATSDLFSTGPLRGAGGPGWGDGSIRPALNILRRKAPLAPNAPQFREVGSLALESGENGLTSAVIDTTNGYAYFGTYASSPGAPAKVVKVRLSDFTRVGAVTLSDWSETALSSAVLDSVNGYAYFGTDLNPAKVIKIRLSDFRRVGALTLYPVNKYLESAVLDAANGYAYFGSGCGSDPGTVVRISLSTFTLAGGLGLSSSGVCSAVLDAADGYAYFGNLPYAGGASAIFKVRLSDFTSAGTLTLNSGEYLGTAASLDSSNGYAYFGTDTIPGKVIKVRLSDFTRVGTLTLDSGEGALASAVIDSSSGHAYFGTGGWPFMPGSSTGKVIKIHLSDFSRVSALTLNSGENSLNSAVVDPANGYAYFGTNTGPGIVVRIDLSSGAESRITLTSSANPSQFGQAVTFTASVSAVTMGTPTGTVTFRDGGITLCSQVPLTNGQAACMVSSLSVGTHTITADYSGDATFDPNGTGLIGGQAVNKSSTTTTVTAHTPDPSKVGQNVAVNYSVIVNPPGSGTPTGNVTVSDGGSSCSASVEAGTCVFTVWAAGVRTLTATYEGDSNFASSATSVSHSVSKADTTTTLSDPPDPSPFGAWVGFGVSVTANPPGGGQPTGLAVVTDGVDSCTASVDDYPGCGLYFSSAGTKVMTATYAGDDNYNGSVSAQETYQVNKADTNTLIWYGDPNLSFPGQPVEFTFVVAAYNSLPTGKVTLSDGAESCSATLVPQYPSVGRGQCSLTFTTPGDKSITATYEGDENRNSSTSPAFEYRVLKSYTTTIITSDQPDPSVLGQAVTVQFSVAASSPAIGTPTGNVTVTAGADLCTASVAAGQCTIVFTSTGNKKLTATYGGDDYFYESKDWERESHTVTPLGTTTAITSDTPDPSVTGQPVTVHYTVTSTLQTITPSGNVTVTDGSNLCAGTVGAGQCTLAFTTAGSKSLIASYAGDTNFNSSSSSAHVHEVNKASTTTTITSDAPDPSVAGQSVMVQYAVAPVAPGAGSPTGGVTVSDGTVSCMDTVAAGKCAIAPTTAGTKNLTANYAGDSNFNGSTSATVPHQVDKAYTRIAITSDNPDPSVVGQPVTVTFAVTVVAPGGGTPNGDVTVSDGTVSCAGSAAAGKCSLTFTTPGVKTLIATFVSDSNYNGSASVAAMHTVNQTGATITLVSSVNPSVVGQTVTFTATVEVVGTGAPTGTVTFKDSGAVLCSSAPLVDGKAACSVPLSSPGLHSITGEYSGDGSFNPSTATLAAGQTVNKANTTTTLTGHAPHPSKAGQAVTVTYSVAVNAPGSGTPSGNVTVSDGVDSCTGSVAAGSCSMTLSTAGTRTLTATYAGDANLNGSSSNGVSHTVNASGSRSFLPLILR